MSRHHDFVNIGEEHGFSIWTNYPGFPKKWFFDEIMDLSQAI
jgi:hypothetical protein